MRFLLFHFLGFLFYFSALIRHQSTESAKISPKPKYSSPPPPPPPSSEFDYPVIWHAPFFSGGGYCSEALGFMESLAPSVKFQIVHHGDSINENFFYGLDEKTRENLNYLHSKQFPPSRSISICHSEPGAWHPANYRTERCPPENSLIKIGRTMFETDRLPDGWADRLNLMDFIWVPTFFHSRIFSSGGVAASKLRVLGEPIDTKKFAGNRSGAHSFDFPSCSGRNSSTLFKFLSVFKFEDRKGWRFLLDGFLREFSRNEPVCLFILTSAYHSDSDFQAKISEFANSLESINHEFPSVELLKSGIPDWRMPDVYANSDAFVIASRGEGWGRPHVEAMSSGIPVIATNWSGPSEFLNEENGFPVKSDGLEEISDGPFKGHYWSKPDVNHLRMRMREVYSNYPAAKLRAARGRRDMKEKYCIKCIRKRVIEELKFATEKLKNGELNSPKKHREEL